MDNNIKILTSKELETTIKRFQPSDPLIKEKQEAAKKLAYDLFKEQDVRKFVYSKICSISQKHTQRL